MRISRTLFLCVLLSMAPCGAPESVQATGPIADDVRKALASGSASFDHAAWGKLLVEGTRDGLVDYDYFRRHRADLEDYLKRLASAKLASLKPMHLMAFLCNAYNALTIRSILDHPGVKSIRDIDGVWTKTTHRVGGHELTLDGIEHTLLRPYFKDPRIHFAINCASRSCAPLPPWAFEGERMDEQLEERARAYLRDPRHVRIEEGTLYLPRYFDWFAGDFTREGWARAAPTVALFVAAYGTPEVAQFAKTADGKPPIAFLDYDWSLNAAAP